MVWIISYNKLAMPNNFKEILLNSNTNKCTRDIQIHICFCQGTMKNLTEKFKYMECVTTKLFFLYGIVSCLFLTMLSLLSSSPPVWYAGDSFSSIFPLERDHHLVRSKFDQMCQNFTWTQYGAIYPNNRLYFCLINLSRTSETQLETRKAK